MQQHPTAPTRPYIGVVAVWALALIGSILVVIIAPEFSRAPWLVLLATGVVLASFIVQLFAAVPEGFIARVAAGAVGGLLLMGAVSVIVALFTLMTL